MGLQDYLRVLRKGWALLLALVVVGCGLGVALTLATEKVYKASVQVFVATSNTTSATDLSQGNTFTQDRVQSYTSIATSPAVTNAVIRRLGLALTNQQLAAKISADAPLNKVLVNLHVTDHNPGQAATLANAVATAFDTVVERTEQTDANGKPVVKLTVIHPATVPDSPIKPNRILNTGLGFLLGLVIGVLVLVLREVLDTTVKAPQDFERLGVPVLGNVPFDKRTNRTPIAFRGDLHSARSEAYRQLRTNLQFVDVDNPPHVISVTSAVPGEGKTTTALNLAAAMAEAGARVCLIEADLRRPTLAKALGLVGDVGFTTALIGKTPVESVLQNAGRNLAVLTSGPIPPNPSELLITAHARDIIRHIADQVDYVVIDTPPLLPVTDGAAVAAIADATLLVTRTGKTTHDQAERSVEALAKVGKRPVGVIMNMVTKGRGAYSYEYGYYYTYKPSAKRGDPPALDAVAAQNASDAAHARVDPAPTPPPPAQPHAAHRRLADPPLVIAPGTTPPSATVAGGVDAAQTTQIPPVPSAEAPAAAVNGFGVAPQPASATRTTDQPPLPPYPAPGWPARPADS